MQKKTLMIAVVIILVAIPLVIFGLLSLFNCGFLDNRICCSAESQICCLSLNGYGCVYLYDSNMQAVCNQACFEAQNRFLGEIQSYLVPYISYCQSNCTEIVPCLVTHVNGTKELLNCSNY